MGGATNAFSAASVDDGQRRRHARPWRPAGTTDRSSVNVTNNSALVFRPDSDEPSANYVDGGTVERNGGSTAVTSAAARASLTRLSGGRHLFRATTVQHGTLKGGAANAFSAASATTVNAGGTLDLGGLAAQTINTVNLAGGVIQNGTLTSADGITSTGGTGRRDRRNNRPHR